MQPGKEMNVMTHFKKVDAEQPVKKMGTRYSNFIFNTTRSIILDGLLQWIISTELGHLIKYLLLCDQALAG